MLGLFKRKRREAALGTLSVLPRPDTEGNARTLMQWPTAAGVASWYYTPEATRARLAEAFPALTPGQLDQACLAVAGLVRAAQAEAPATERRRSAWAGWKPARSLSDLPTPSL